MELWRTFGSHWSRAGKILSPLVDLSGLNLEISQFTRYNNGPLGQTSVIPSCPRSGSVAFMEDVALV